MKLTKKIKKMAAVLLTTLMVVMMLMAVPFTASTAEDTDTVVYPGDKVTVTYSFAKDIPEGCEYYYFETNYPIKAVKYNSFKNQWVLKPRIDKVSIYYYKIVPIQGMTADNSHYGPQVKSGQKIISVIYDVIKEVKVSDLKFPIIKLELGINDQYGYLRDLSYLSYDVEITSKGEKPTEPTTVAPTTTEPTTEEPTTEEPTEAPTTVEPTTVAPTTVEPTTVEPTTVEPTEAPTTVEPTTVETTTEPTEAPTTVEPTTVETTTVEPTTEEPTEAPTTEAPATVEPTTVEPTTEPTEAPTTVPVTTQPITEAPTVTQPTTIAPSTEPTVAPSTEPTTPTTTVAPVAATATPDEPSNGGNGSNDNGIVKTGQNMPAMIPVSIITMALTFAVMRFCRRKRSK